MPDTEYREVTHGVWTTYKVPFPKERRWPSSGYTVIADNCIVSAYQHKECSHPTGKDAAHFCPFPICPYCGAEMKTKQEEENV